MPPAPRFAAMLLALALSAPLAGAATVPSEPRACVEGACVVTQDQDEDGDLDWANVAFSYAGLVFLNLNVNATNVTWWGGFTFEEYEALHGPDEHSLGADSWGYANLTAQDEGPGFNDTDAHAFVYQLDHETGDYDVVYEGKLFAGDTDGDGRPDRICRDLLP